MCQPFVDQRGHRTNAPQRRIAAGSWVLLMAVFATPGCNTSDMRDQPKYEPLEASTLFADDQASRPLVEGTVARGQLRIDHHLYEGRVNGELVTTFPEPVDRATLLRGREQFGIFCTPCHGEVGFGDGMAVQRGYPRPPSFHTDRLREEPVGHLYDVITNGLGRMMDYSAQVKPADRWAIVAYIRALQRSQHATRAMLSAKDLAALETASAPPRTPPSAAATDSSTE